MGRPCHSISSIMRGVVLMSTYEEFQIILTACMLMAAILAYSYKK